MLLLFFSLLNIAFFIAFIYVGYKAIILVRKEIGLWAAIILFFGLLSNSSSTHYNNANLNQKTTDNAVKQVMGSQKFQRVLLEENLLMDINLTFIYGIDTNTKQYVYTDATSTMTGFTGSCRWIPENISINFIDSKHFAYHVSGMMEWKFFKSTFNREEKNFKGIIEIK